VELATDDFVTRARMGQRCQQIAHRAARNEQAGCFAQKVRGALFEGTHRGVFAIDVVANLGRGHCGTYAWRRQRHGVAAQIDGCHAAGPA
jgi:hypothetical protein